MRPVTLRGLSGETLALVAELQRGASQDLFHRIAQRGEPTAIRDLMPFATSSSGAREAIQRLFAVIPLEALPILDGWLRCWPGSPDLRAHDIRGIEVAGDADRVFVGLLASHGNGHVREEALRRLVANRSPVAIPFVLLRLTDWVEQVRRIAADGLEVMLAPQSARTLVDCLALLDRLANRRLSRQHLDRIEQLLVRPECAADLVDGMSHPSRVVRRRCFPLAAQNPAIGAGEVFAKAWRDGDVLVRKWAFEASPDLERAVNDPFPSIRRLAFDGIATGGPSCFEQLLPFLFDRSAGIRRDCQLLVTKPVAAGHYRARLAGARPGLAEICILGLGETGDPDDRTAVAGLLADPSPRVRRAAVRALRSVSGSLEAALRRLLAADVTRVAREAAETLLGHHRLPAVAVWALALENPSWNVRAHVLRLSRYSSKWEQLRVYLSAVADPEAEVRARASDLTVRWCERFNSSFVQPSEAESRAIAALIARGSGQASGTRRRSVGLSDEGSIRSLPCP